MNPKARLKNILATPKSRPAILQAAPLSSADRLELEREIAERGPWFHNMNLAEGVWTNSNASGPGLDYPAARWEWVKDLIGDVAGKHCLDVGCSSGFFSLKLRQLGAASVLGVDQGEQLKAIEQARFATKTLGMDVEFRPLSAYDLASLPDSYDLVLFLGVFYHLRHPMVALEAIRKVCRGRLIIQTVTIPHDGGTSKIKTPEIMTDTGLRAPSLLGADAPMMRFVPGALDGDGSCWFVPNVQAVMALLSCCGFESEQVVYPNPHELIVTARVK
jgi:tRNA (mo5U34)-methyltransferase